MFLKSPQKRVLQVRLQRAIILPFLMLCYIVMGQSFNGYYNSADGLQANALKLELHNIIKNHTEFSYTASGTDVWDILKETDKDPNNANNVILIYSGRSVNAAQEYNSANGWNREHVWAKSRGNFGTARGAGTDVHHLRPADIGVNSTRNNRSFDDCTACVTIVAQGVTIASKYDSSVFTFEPRDAVKGDVARMLFYMAVRYEGENGEPDLELTENIPVNTDKSPLHGKLSTLLAWHLADPVDDWERNRNTIIFNNYQHNRNPFIDFPEMVDYIWGTKTNNIWLQSSTLAVADNNHLFFTIYPNPTSYKIVIKTPTNASKHIGIYDVIGKQVYQKTTTDTQINIGNLKAGLYFVRVQQEGKTATQKLVVE
ncbi:MAG: endonuclease [Flavobacteriaceae bacterium]|nr:endonuclease [Flavobacteriaceae bacterium]